MDRTLYGFILRHSRREQLLIVPFVLATMVVYFFSLDLPKTIINQAIQGKSFPTPDATAMVFHMVVKLPEFLGGATLTIFEGMSLERIPYLFVLSMVFVLLIVLNGALKFQINTMKGWMGERMLRRLRYSLTDMIFRFPLNHFRRVKSAEFATMIKDEVEPLGGFIGESLITPLFLSGQALTAIIFILYQQVYLGMIAVTMVTVQAFIIPRLRRRLLVLAKQRQLGARHLAGRIGECVDGVLEIHANDTSNYERAEIASRLGNLFRIRFEYYQRKFLIKFLNNFLAQVTPFLFYTIGGYLVIVGKLDIGSLVAVIAAYRDLPDPVKELIDWDQERLDVSIKYAQVMEQFAVEHLAAPETQPVIAAPELPRQGNIVASNLTLMDDSGVSLLKGVSFELPLDRHIAVLGNQSSGRTELGLVLAGLIQPTSGALEVGGVDLLRAPEAITGRAIGYVAPSSYLFPLSVRDNLLYSLKHYPGREAQYKGQAKFAQEFRLYEAQRTGNSTLDINADWVDYRAAGAASPAELEQRLHNLLAMVELNETIFELGLRSTVNLERNPDIAETLLRARQQMTRRLDLPEMRGLVERFDPALYMRNATLGENLLFGTPVGDVFDFENLARHAYVRQVLDDTGLSSDLLQIGQKVAQSMVELFSGLPPGHEMFERFSFIKEDDLPLFRDLLSRIAKVGVEGIDERARNLILSLPFKLISTRHRLGLIDEAMEGRILVARRYFAEHLPEHLRGAVAFFDPGTYSQALSLQDNILFGKVVTSRAGATASINALMRQVLDDLDLHDLVVKVGLDYQVGVGGTRLATADRQKAAIARAMLKQPTMLVLDQPESVLDPATQRRLVTSVLRCRPDSSVIWLLQRPDLAELFDEVIVLNQGQIVERGRFAEIRNGGGELQRLLNAS